MDGIVTFLFGAAIFGLIIACAYHIVTLAFAKDEPVSDAPVVRQSLPVRIAWGLFQLSIIGIVSVAVYFGSAKSGEKPHFGLGLVLGVFLAFIVTKALTHAFHFLSRLCSFLLNLRNKRKTRSDAGRLSATSRSSGKALQKPEAFRIGEDSR